MIHILLIESLNIEKLDLEIVPLLGIFISLTVD